MRQNGLLVAIGALLLLTAGAARAEEVRPLKDRTCTGECRRQHHACVDAARAEARMCVAATCGAEQAAAQAACEADPESEACAQAREAFRTCLAPCLDVYHEAIRVCRARAKECAELCPTVTPPPPLSGKDRLCVGECRLKLSLCIVEARETSVECQTGCQDLAAAAREACADGRSEACAAAREALQECLEPCHQALRKATVECTRAAYECVEQCPDKPGPPSPERPLRGH